jgi:hypothetical protein
MPPCKNKDCALTSRASRKTCAPLIRRAAAEAGFCGITFNKHEAGIHPETTFSCFAIVK